VGEKGVGLTYAVFSGDRFEIESRCSGSGTAAGTVLNAQSWLNTSAAPARPAFQKTPIGQERGETKIIDGKEYPLDSFTRISVSEILPPENDVNVFLLDAYQLKLLLQTHTAVGVTRSLFSPAVHDGFDTYINFELKNGNLFSQLESCFLAPHTLIPEGSRISLQAVRDAFVGKSDAKSRRKFLGTRTVWDRTTVDIDGWQIDVYGVMFPENDTFRSLAKDVLKIPIDAGEGGAGNLFQSGIYVGTKGMPTGMRIEPKAGGRYPAYYKRCFFLVESPALKFDLGRKSLHYRYTARLQSAVASLFSKFEEIAPFQGEGKADAVTLQMTKAERQALNQKEWADALGLAELGETAIPYVKIPNGQEAAVAAIFHELLGARLLKGFSTLSTGYSTRYDVHAQYAKSGHPPLRIVIEFKHNLESLVRDLVEKKKYFYDIDLLVAWDADEQKLRDGDFHIEPTTSGEFFDGVTHNLTVPVPGIEPIPVILLRTFFDRRKAGTG
jgi:hypothetical protein